MNISVQRRERNRYLTRWSSSFLVVHLKKSVGFSLHHSLINEITKCRTPPKPWFIASLGNNITFNIQFDILIDRRITPLDWSSSSHFTHPCHLEQHFILQSQNFFDVTSKKKKKNEWLKNKRIIIPYFKGLSTKLEGRKLGRRKERKWRAKDNWRATYALRDKVWRREGRGEQRCAAS